MNSLDSLGFAEEFTAVNFSFRWPVSVCSIRAWTDTWVLAVIQTDHHHQTGLETAVLDNPMETTVAQASSA